MSKWIDVDDGSAGGYAKWNIGTEEVRPMDDLISRQAAIDALAEHEKSKNHNYVLFRTVVSECAEIIREVPTIEERKGRWIPKPELGWGEIYVCSECGEKTTSTIMGKPRYRYCPMCGADMRGEDE